MNMNQMLYIVTLIKNQAKQFVIKKKNDIIL